MITLKLVNNFELKCLITNLFIDGGDGNAGIIDDPSSTASSDLSLSMSRHAEPREDPEIIKQWKEDQVIGFASFVISSLLIRFFI